MIKWKNVNKIKKKEKSDKKQETHRKYRLAIRGKGLRHNDFHIYAEKGDWKHKKGFNKTKAGQGSLDGETCWLFDDPAPAEIKEFLFQFQILL